MRICEKILFLGLILHAQRPESADKPVFFAQSQPITQTIVTECTT